MNQKKILCGLATQKRASWNPGASAPGTEGAWNQDVKISESTMSISPVWGH